MERVLKRYRLISPTELVIAVLAAAEFNACSSSASIQPSPAQPSAPAGSVRLANSLAGSSCRRLA